MSMLGFKARAEPLTYVLCHLCVVNSSDSPVVSHLLTSWLPAVSIPILAHPTVLVGLESGSERAT